MNINNKIITILNFILCCCLISCKTLRLKIVPIIETKSMTVKDSSNAKDKSQTYTLKCNIEVKYPQLKGLNNLSLQDSLNHCFKKYFFRLSNSVCVNSLKGLEYPVYPGMEGKSIYNYYQEGKYIIYSLSEKMISISLHHLDYSVRDYSVKTYNVNLKTSEFFTWDDVFNKKYRKEFFGVFVKYFGYYKKAYELYGTIPINGLYMALTKTHCVFFFTGQDISYLEKVKIPKKELKKFIHKQYKHLW